MIGVSGDDEGVSLFYRRFGVGFDYVMKPFDEEIIISKLAIMELL